LWWQGFFWHWTKPRGQSGGILLGINLQLFDIGNITLGDYHIKFNVKTKVDDFEWALIAAYGVAQDEFKEAFVTEMVQICSTDDKPTLIGGDFNIIRSPAEKNNDRYNDRWPFLFNACIERLDFRELDLSGRCFTWENNLDTPTFERLDRILVSTHWEQKFPLTVVQALTRESSDHTPLLLDTGTPTVRGNQRSFQFELSWLIKEGFYEQVAEVWNNEKTGINSLQRWQYKIIRTRQYLRGWGKHIKGHNNKEKEDITSMINLLDKKRNILSYLQMSKICFVSLEIESLICEEKKR
jgi:endonuclease/exonuclease/phosphatase family metal-dependent hydrolase